MTEQEIRYIQQAVAIFISEKGYDILEKELKTYTSLSQEAEYWLTEKGAKINEENIQEVINSMDEAGEIRARECKEQES